MASTLLLDQVTWDLAVDTSGNIAVASDPYSQAQDAASSIKTFAGESVLRHDARHSVLYANSRKIAARFAHESIFQRSRASRPRRHQFPNVHYGMGRAHTFGTGANQKHNGRGFRRRILRIENGNQCSQTAMDANRFCHSSNRRHPDWRSS